ncbi:hypothetical protein NHP190012_09350 [Helicobacter sp. NHP19-012]|uniref:Outer membrane protein n=1 Tax=Helicobacter gastrofelis TaxID=2849642 RepID=A0ABM7SID0_9HELI|nr:MULTISPECIES: outer membrane protein [unclassified Helicobacter]BCZ19293.1 hypothetical protein NHP190012_09350 [Helicobacter sp. NHP19-012]
MVKTTNSGASYGKMKVEQPTFSYKNGQSNMYGFGFNIGYKAFFGKSKRNGLRFFAYYDYGYSNPNFDGPRYNLNAYGAGMDYLFDFINKDDTQVGFFIGFALAGNSWNNSGASNIESTAKYLNDVLAPLAAANDGSVKASTNFSYFQLPIQWGIRANVSKHQGFEFGMKIPLVRNYYFKSVAKSNAPGDKAVHIDGITFQRSVVFYANYVINF